MVGWDRPLSTFFLLIRPPQEADVEQVWLGMSHGEFYDLDDFLPVLASHGVIPVPLLVVALYMDRDMGGGNLVTDWRSGEPIPVEQG